MRPPRVDETTTATDTFRRGASSATDGLLLVDKPAGMTSHDVVQRVRRIYGERSIGHLGTLDPFATGLLVLLLGKATRLGNFLDTEPRVYQATIRFGVETDTDDKTGTEIRTAALPAPEAARAAVESFIGTISQVPPAYSAKSVDGTRAYDAARRGEPLLLPAVDVTVHGWEITAQRENEMDAVITCSGGTYIRALARDIGRAVGSAAHLSALRRVKVGEFAVAAASTLDELAAAPARIRPLRVVADA
jgi:tRNA pseudouridine55 synthase